MSHFDAERADLQEVLSGEEGTAPFELDEEDVPLGPGLVSLLPRRNHTISASTARMKKRLPQHFEQPISPTSTSTSSPTSHRQSQHQRGGSVASGSSVLTQLQQEMGSPNRNSLKEIVGLENEHQEWERAILDERSSAAEQLANLPQGGSTTTSGRSSPLVSTSSVRRHQSLNHHLGRGLAGRVTGSATSNRHTAANQSGSSSRLPPSFAHTPPSITAQLQSAFGAGASSDDAGATFSSTATLDESGPDTPASWSQSQPWPPREQHGSGRASPSRYTHTFTAPNASQLARGSSPSPSAGTHGGGHLNLMDVHASLATMDLGGGQAPSYSYLPASASNTASNLSPSRVPLPPKSTKRLPSLVTDLDTLAKGTMHAHQGSDSFAGPASAAPYLPVSQRRSGVFQPGHAKNQSTDGVLRPTPYSPPSGSTGPSGLQLGALLDGPHTAAPSTWSQREEILEGHAPERGGTHQTPSPLMERLAMGDTAATAKDGTDMGRSRSIDRNAVPSQWGLGLTPVAEGRGNHQLTLALSRALAEQRERTAFLENALLASTGMLGGAPGTPSYQQDQQQPQQQQQLGEYGNGFQLPPHQRGPIYGVEYPRPSPQQGRDRVPLHPHGHQPAPSHSGRIHHHQSSNGDAGQFSFPPRPPTGPNSLPSHPHPAPPASSAAATSSLAARLQLNPDHFELSPRPSARFLVIKSFTEDDVHRSIRHGIWASTDKGNQRLDRVFKECQEAAKAESDDASSNAPAGDVPPGHVYLFFSVNGSGQFCGMALMTSAVDFETSSSVWAQEGKWKGHFKVKHIFVKDIPNRELRHIKLENSVENKSVTQSRDTQELGRSQGEEMLRIFYGYPSRTSLLHDMDFYDEEERRKKGGEAATQNGELPLRRQGPPPPLHGGVAQDTITMSPSAQALPFGSARHPHSLPLRPSAPQVSGNGDAAAAAQHASPSLGYSITPTLQTGPFPVPANPHPHTMGMSPAPPPGFPMEGQGPYTPYTFPSVATPGQQQQQQQQQRQGQGSGQGQGQGQQGHFSPHPHAQPQAQDQTQPLYQPYQAQYPQPPPPGYQSYQPQAQSQAQAQAQNHSRGQSQSQAQGQAQVQRPTRPARGSPVPPAGTNARPAGARRSGGAAPAPVSGAVPVQVPAASMQGGGRQ